MFSQECQYFAILGTDFLSKIGIDNQHSTNHKVVQERTSNAKYGCTKNSEGCSNIANVIEIQTEERIFGKIGLRADCLVSPILDAKCEQVKITDLVEQP